MIDRPLPADLDAEQSILGAMMVRPDLIPSVLEQMTAADCYRSAHSLTFESIVELFENGEPVEMLTVCESLRKRDHLELVGGKMAVFDMAAQVAVPDNAAHLAEMVAEKAALRRTITVAYDAMEQAYDLPDNVGSFIAETMEGLRKVRGGRQQSKEKKALQVADETMDYIEKAYRGEHEPGVTTGFRTIDRLTDGLVKGTLNVVAARPGQGKSAFVTNIAREAARSTRVLMFSLEMSSWEIGLRLYAQIARVNWAKIRNGELPYDQFQRLYAAGDDVAALQLSVFDAGSVRVGDIRAEAANHPDCGLVIIDYLQLLGSKGKQESKNVEIGEMTRALKVMAKDLNVPVILVSQLNRDLEKRQVKRPQLSDLRDSGSIEQDADVVMFISEREDRQVPMGTPTVIDVAKNRNGPVGEVDLTFYKPHARFFMEGDTNG